MEDDSGLSLNLIGKENQIDKFDKELIKRLIKN